MWFESTETTATDEIELDGTINVVVAVAVAAPASVAVPASVVGVGTMSVVASLPSVCMSCKIELNDLV